MNHKLSSSCYDIILFQEIWYNSTVNTNELTHMTNYQAFRRDRAESTKPRKLGSGVITLVNKKLKSEIISINKATLVQVIVIKTTTTNNESIIIVNCYIPPYHTLTSIKELFKILHKIRKKFKSLQSLVIGDFNQFKLKWIPDSDTNQIVPDIKEARKIEISILTEINRWGMSQLNYKSNNNGSYLDLIFSNDKLVTSVVECLDSYRMDRHSIHYSAI